MRCQAAKRLVRKGLENMPGEGLEPSRPEGHRILSPRAYPRRWTTMEHHTQKI